MEFYFGGHNECSYHWKWLNEIVDLDPKGECPKQAEHLTAGPGSHFA